jgi:hypothetical protein
MTHQVVSQICSAMAIAGLLCMSIPMAFSQTAGTGALSGTVTDQSQAVVPEAKIRVRSDATGEERTVISSGSGNYTAALLVPGGYHVEVTATGYKAAIYQHVGVTVTETRTLDVQLQVGAVTEQVTVEGNPDAVQTESSALGRVVDDKVVQSLPLVTRNFTQIVGLSAGVVAPVNNANELGRGSGGLSFTGGFSVHGSRNYDNNFELNGADSNDLFASGGNSGGVAIPNPDAIEQFKVQTGQYDASYGRNMGANVNIVTKGGGSHYHGTLFEFFRNNDLNANSFFFNRGGLPRGVLKQNQFGATFGGPVIKDKLFFFGEYQGTRQRNGIATGCSTTYVGPPLTDDRSAAAIGALFGGKAGSLGGVAVASNGSNINPVALKLLQLKLPNGQYMIPTPYAINASNPFSTQGQYALTGVCGFDEDQYMGNADYLQSPRSTFSSRLFEASSTGSIPYTGTSTISYPTKQKNTFINYSLGHTYIFSPSLLNEAKFGYHYIHAMANPTAPFKWSDVGVTEVAQENPYPAFSITGFSSMAAPNVNIPQNYFEVRDSLTWLKGRHTVRLGGGLQHVAMDFKDFAINSTAIFLSFPDFLLGLPGASTASGGNGTPFSNVFGAADLVGLLDRHYKVWSGWGYAQDDFKVSRRLTVNVGLRYERMGDVGDALGRNAGIDPSALNPNPPATGSLAGYVVPSNFNGTIPTGVTQLNNTFGIKGDGQNVWEPRFGFAWQPASNSSRFVVRGGYGIYYTRLVGQQYLQLVTSPPFSLIRQVTSVANAGASFANPFQPAVQFPVFPAYTPTSSLTPRFLAQDYRPSMTQQYSLNLQMLLPKQLLLEIGYVGARGTHLLRTRSVDQALLASATNPIRGVTTNTVANITARLPFQGFTPSGLQQVESAGSSWYNALETTLSRHVGKNLEFIAAYTFSRLLDTDGGNASLTQGGNVVTLGNQVGSSRYGPADFNREHRLVISYVYQIPNPLKDQGFGRVTGEWAVSGVSTFQSGQRLTISATNSNNVFGITADRAQLAAGCTASQLGSSGSLESRLNGYFNASCFAPFAIIGDDGKGTAFGNSGVGIVKGPGQGNFDISLSKRTALGFLNEASNLEFRAEFFNAFNTPQFANPDANFSSATFGRITNTAVNPRIIQLALKLHF